MLIDAILKLLTIAGLLLVYGAALYGWGRCAERIVRLSLPVPVTVCLGVAFVLFIGGVANLASIAYAATLDVLTVIGLLAAALDTMKRPRRALDDKATMRADGDREGYSNTARILAAGLMGVVFVFVAMTQVPPDAMNFHDDFETYLLFPVHMLATGSVDTGPLSNIGIASLGGLSFLQGFVLAHWPLATVNAVDALFGLLLCMATIFSIAERLGLPAWQAILVMAVIIFIDPQYVNVSSIYLASALLMLVAFVPLGRSCQETTEERTEDASTGRAAIVGLSYAALVSLKMTFFLPLLIHFIVSVIAVAFAGRCIWLGLVWGAKVGSFGLAAILPWVLALAESRFLGVFGDRGVETSTSAPGTELTPPMPEFFSTQPVHYAFGASYLHYTTIVFFVLVFALALAFWAYRQDRARMFGDLWQVAFCLFLPIYFVLSSLTIGRFVMGHDANLRYIVPMLLGAVPASILFFAATARNRVVIARPTGRGGAITALMVSLPAICILAQFAPPLAARGYQAVQYGSVLGFNRTARQPAYIEFNSFAMGEEAYAELADIQVLVPEGATIVAAVSLPFHLNFRRNDVLVVHGGGLGWPYQDFPFNGDTAAVKGYFSDRSIDYVLWQKDGFAVRDQKQYRRGLERSSSSHRRISQYSLDFFGVLQRLEERSDVVYSDDKFTLFRVQTHS